MKLKFMDAPGKLTIGNGEDAFILLVRPLRGGERAMMIDACATGSLVHIQKACESMVEDWANVQRDDGTPVVYRSTDESGKLVCNFGRALEAMGSLLHMETLAAIIAYLGLPTGDIDRFMKLFPGRAIDSTPTEPQDDGTPKSGSGN